jgi:hypothetical protein
MNLFIKRFANLLTVKSIITLVLLAVFAFLTLTAVPISPEFMELFKLVVIFYFGTQAGKAETK